MNSFSGLRRALLKHGYVKEARVLTALFSPAHKKDANVLRATRKLRLAGYGKLANKLLVVARGVLYDDSETDTEKDPSTIDVFEHEQMDDEAYVAAHNEAIVDSLKFLGRELIPILNKGLKDIKRSLLSGKITDPKAVFEGVVSSLKQYGFKALDKTPKYVEFAGESPEKSYRRNKRSQDKKRQEHWDWTSSRSIRM